MSVIVPVYNVAPYLTKCIKSILNQTLKDIEIVCVDDGSTDGSSQILEEIYSTDHRIQIISKPNGGLSSARNVGLDSAKGEYVFFMDSDDYLDTKALEYLHKSVVQNQSDLAVGEIVVDYGTSKTYSAIDRNSDKQYYSVKQTGTYAINDSLLYKTNVSSCGKLFRRSLIEQNTLRYPVGLKYEDAYFFYAYCWRADKINYIDKNVYNYVRRDDSIMAKTFKGSDSALDHLYIAIHLFDTLKNSQLFDKHHTLYTQLFIDYFRFAMRFMPLNKRYVALNVAYNFIKRNELYISSIDQVSYDRMRGVLPERIIRFRLKYLVKHRLFRKIESIMNLISPTFRLQRATVSKLDSILNN